MGSIVARKILVAIVTFVASAVSYALFCVLLTFLSVSTLGYLDAISSFITSSTLIVVGILGAYWLSLDDVGFRNTVTNQVKSICFAIFSAWIFTCYIAYILLKLDNFNNEVITISFNIATISKSLLIMLILSKNNGRK